MNVTSLDESSWLFTVKENPEIPLHEEIQEVYETENVENDAWKIEIYEATSGRKVVTDKMEEKQYQVSTSGWKPGTYIVRVFTKNKVLSNKILVK